MNVEGHDRSPRVVVVTGASAGVGRATVRAFASRGASIGLLARGTEGLRASANDVEAQGSQALPISVDVADSAAVDEAAARIEEDLGPRITALSRRLPIRSRRSSARSTSG